LFGSLRFSSKDSEIRKKCLLGHSGASGMGAASVSSADCLDTVYIMEDIQSKTLIALKRK